MGSEMCIRDRLYKGRAPLFAYAFMRTGNERFLARTKTGDLQAVERLMASDPLGAEFSVVASERRNDLIA